MPTLRELQQQFAAAVFHGDTALQDHIVSTEAASAAERIAIYRASVLGIQSDALAAIYPVVQQLVGEKFFTAMAHTYLQQHPSPSGDLHQLGEQMGDFLGDYAPAASLPYLADTARLEWACHRAFHAADDPTFDFTAFAEIPAEQQGALVFSPSHSLQTLDSPWPVHRIWAMHQDDAEQQQQKIDLDEGDAKLLVSRPQRSLEITPLSDPQWTFIQQIRQGATLNTLLADDSLASHVPELLPQAISQGWVVHFRLEPAPSAERS